MAGSGEIFGELALLYDCPRSATVLAHTDCELYRASRETFRTLQAAFVLDEDDATRKLLKKTKLFEDLPGDIIHEMATYLFQKKFPVSQNLAGKGGPDVHKGGYRLLLLMSCLTFLDKLLIGFF